MSKVLVISDLQAPFEHHRYLDFLKKTYDKYRCDTVVCIGDEVDFHALSDYDHDPDGYSAGHELKAAIAHLRPYYKAFPDVMVCHSNHAMRIFNKAFKAGIPSAAVRGLKEMLKAPNEWRWREKWEIDGVVYKHGLGYSGTLGALNAAKDEHKPCVIGHLHSDAGVLFFNNGDKVIFGLNVGCGIDSRAYAFAYGKDCRKKPVISCGVIIDGNPHLITMRLP